jgi:replicative DNA helicase
MSEYTHRDYAVNQVVRIVVDKMEEFYHRKGSLTEMATGWPDLDAVTGGLQRGQWTCLVSPHGGEDEGLDWLLSLVRNLLFPAREGAQSAGVLWCGTLGCAETVTLRLMCNHAAIAIRRLYDGFAREQDRQCLRQCAEELAKKPLWIHDGCRTVAQLCAAARAIGQRGKVDLIVLENVSLNDWNPERIAELKAAATELDAACISLSCLDSIHANVNPWLPSADAIWALRPNTKSKEPHSMELSVLKGFWQGSIPFTRSPLGGRFENG